MEKIICGDSLAVLKTLESESVDCVITSPPYWGLRDYGVAGQMGLEKSPEEFVENMMLLFREVRRVLKKDGTLWLNIGDSYAGSGRGRDADGTWNPGKGGSKQETNVGAITGRAVNSKSFSKKAIEAGVIGNAWVKPPPGIKAKDLVGIPWMLAFALRADGWYLRQDIIWHKPNPMPESVADRCTKAHEYVFLLTKSSAYYYDADAIKTQAKSTVIARPAGWATGSDHSAVGWATEKNQGRRRPNGISRNRELGYNSKENFLRGNKNTNPTGMTEKTLPDGPSMANKRSVWSVQTEAFSEAHFATFPEKLIEPMILAGCPKGGTILDPFSGAATTGVVAKKFGRNYIGIELNPEYVAMSEQRLARLTPPLFV